ncbi:universal stress protein [Streptomyces sp. NPDC004629]|uniref:universal stress protein n=1 Tax=Streptomyces sp. NPDC004629 TaxID=3364705 RepID=UPI003682A229
MSHPVLAGVDGSRRSLEAADWAAREAVLRGVALSLVHVSPVPPTLPGDRVPVLAAETLQDVGERMLRRAVADLSGRYPDIEVRGEQTDGAAAAALAAAARGAALLVVGTRGSGGFDGLAVGSVALAAASAAPCPVVLVPAPSAGAHGGGTGPAPGAAQVVVGLDPHRPAGPVADFAFSAAQARGAALRAVRAWALPAESVSPRTLFVTEEDRATWEDQEVLELSDALRGWRERYPAVTVRTDVVLLHPAEALLNAARRAGLLVVGSGAGPGTAGGRLGPVTHAVLHHAHCPVAVVPYAG